MFGSRYCLLSVCPAIASRSAGFSLKDSQSLASSSPLSPPHLDRCLASGMRTSPHVLDHKTRLHSELVRLGALDDCLAGTYGTRCGLGAMLAHAYNNANHSPADLVVLGYRLSGLLATLQGTLHNAEIWCCQTRPLNPYLVSSRKTPKSPCCGMPPGRCQISAGASPSQLLSRWGDFPNGLLQMRLRKLYYHTASIWPKISNCTMLWLICDPPKTILSIPELFIAWCCSSVVSESQYLTAFGPPHQLIGSLHNIPAEF